VEAFWWSTGVVALGEMGDKTQLLALLLAARFKRPWPIVGGIVFATLANHAMAGMLGHWVARWLGADVLRWVVGLGFLAMAAWMLVPDRVQADEADRVRGFSVFATTALAFFIAEMGDKTQIATVALAARHPELIAVVLGTTFGLVLANVPVVFAGDRLLRRVSMPLLHRLAALLFALMGVLALFDVGGVGAARAATVHAAQWHRGDCVLRAGGASTQCGAITLVEKPR
jgi:putative Ca2+/H+ antiporter (TMEM165/GDT1 family)